MRASFESLDAPGWIFCVREVSYGHYYIEGRDAAGRSISRHGSDYDALLKQGIEDARSICPAAGRSAKGSRHLAG